MIYLYKKIIFINEKPDYFSQKLNNKKKMKNCNVLDQFNSNKSNDSIKKSNLEISNPE